MDGLFAPSRRFFPLPGRKVATLPVMLPLLLWTLVLIVTPKYVTLIIRADNRGAGGPLSLVESVQKALIRRPALLLAIVVVGLSLLFGEDII